MRLLLARTTIASLPIGAALACGSSTAPPPSAVEVDAALSADADASDGGNATATDAPDSAAQCVLSRRFGSELCDRCLKERCCSPILACESDASCKVLLDCSQACILGSSNVPECIERCLQQTPAGRDKYKAFEACIAASPQSSVPGCAFDCSQ